MKVVVNGQYTYETDLELEVGDTVLCPTPDFLRDVKGPTWEAEVTGLGSDYAGPCARLVGKVPKMTQEEKENQERAKYREAIERNLPYLIPKGSNGKWTAYYAKYQRLEIHELATAGNEKQVKSEAMSLFSSMSLHEQFVVIKNPKGELTQWADLTGKTPVWYDLIKKEKKNKKEVGDIGPTM